MKEGVIGFKGNDFGTLISKINKWNYIRPVHIINISHSSCSTTGIDRHNVYTAIITYRMKIKEE